MRPRLGEVAGLWFGLARLFGPPDSSQRLGPGGVQVAEVVEAFGDAQAGLGSLAMAMPRLGFG